MSRYRITFRDGTTREYQRWEAVIRATRPGSVVDRRTPTGWERVELLYGLARRK
jgi:hypothetical protein